MIYLATWSNGVIPVNTYLTLTNLNLANLAATQCLNREMFVTQLCLQIWSGGTAAMLASPK
jgi:hypothetical protein